MRGILSSVLGERHSGPLLLLFESVRFDNWFALKNRVLLIKLRFGKIPSLIQVLLPFIVSKSNHLTVGLPATMPMRNAITPRE